jgi:hypothetical protein
MNSDEWSKRAFAFGQMALDASKTVRECSANAGREIFVDAFTLSQKVANSRQPKSRWDRRQGTWNSDKSLEESIVDAKLALRDSVRVVALNVCADYLENRIIAKCSWRENLPKFPNSFHEVTLRLDFSEATAGTLIEYDWKVDDFPKGVSADRVIREANQVLESALEDWVVAKKA